MRSSRMSWSYRLGLALVVVGACLPGDLLARREPVDPIIMGVGMTWPQMNSVAAAVGMGADDASSWALVPRRAARFHAGLQKEQLAYLVSLGFDRQKVDVWARYPTRDELESYEYAYEASVNDLDFAASMRGYLQDVRVGRASPYLGAGLHRAFVWGDFEHSLEDEIDDDDLVDAMRAEQQRMLESLSSWGGQLGVGGSYFAAAALSLGWKPGWPSTCSARGSTSASSMTTCCPRSGR